MKYSQIIQFIFKQIKTTRGATNWLTVRWANRNSLLKIVDNRTDNDFFLTEKSMSKPIIYNIRSNDIVENIINFDSVETSRRGAGGPSTQYRNVKAVCFAWTSSLCPDRVKRKVKQSEILLNSHRNITLQTWGCEYITGMETLSTKDFLQ